MSEQTRRAYFQELLDQSWLYRLRTAIRHGIPVMPGRNVIVGAKTQAVPSEQVADDGRSSSGIGSRLALALALALGGTGAAAGIYAALRPAETTVVNQGGDLLDWLDEEGVAP